MNANRLAHAVEAVADAIVEEARPEVREDLVANLIDLVRTDERAKVEAEWAAKLAALGADPSRRRAS